MRRRKRSFTRRRTTKRFLSGAGLSLLFVAAALVVNVASAWSSSKVSEYKTPSFYKSSATTTRLQAAAGRVPPPIPPPPPPPPQDLLQDLEKAIDSFKKSNAVTSSSIQESLQSLKTQIASLDAQVLKQLNVIASGVESSLLQDYPQIQPLYQKLTALVTPLLQSPTITILVSSLVTFWLVSSVLTWGQPPPASQPYPNNRYDPASARSYFDKRLPLVISRGLFILVQSLSFATKIIKDKIDNKIAENEVKRGRELAELLTRLGPSFIKIGQSLSIRTDLLSPAYARGLSSLQDQVPAFDTATARQILEQEWGRPIEQVLDGGGLPAQPVAAASLGQVYRAQLKSKPGQFVAIKVQRPDITEQIALDMHLLREMAPVAKRTFNLNTDTVGTVDTWGEGFIAELDYFQEAQNAQYFSERILQTSLANVVLAPTVVNDLTTQRVLTTEWIDGQRLDECNSDDVTVLCSIAMNTYLTMLLDDRLAVLHADPHPGNILRTNDGGKLCILDWGMVTRLDTNIQLTLIEHVAHLTSGDYAEVPKDLYKLGFIPEDKLEFVQDSDLVELLADIYGAWYKGGGAASVNVNDVVNQLQDLTAEKGNLFQIPPYFAYIAKSFSVLEGIGLSNDPKYSIVKECLPYVSQRLLTDYDKMGSALSTFVFGPNKGNRNRIVDYDRVEQLVEGFADYSTSASGSLLAQGDLSRAETLQAVANQVLDLVFTEEETPLQEILIDQVAKLTASSSRYIWTQLRERSGVLPSGRTVLGTIMDPLGVWRTSPLVRMNQVDDEALETTRKLIGLAQSHAETGVAALDLTTLSRQEAAQFGSILARSLWERRRGIFQTGNRFARRLLQLTADTLEDGERDSRTLPERKQLESSSALVAESQSSTSFTTKVNGAAIQPVSTQEETSSRLEKARRLLVELQD